MGNVGSIQNMLLRIGKPCVITSDPEVLKSVDKLILPGVGSFDNAVSNLNRLGLGSLLNELVIDRGMPILGICLGMELLFDHTTERETNCLGVISGTINKFRNGQTNLKVPHLGWNEVKQNQSNPLFDGIKSGEHFYFDLPLVTS